MKKYTVVIQTVVGAQTGPMDITKEINADDYEVDEHRVLHFRRFVQGDGTTEPFALKERWCSILQWGMVYEPDAVVKQVPVPALEHADATQLGRLPRAKI